MSDNRKKIRPLNSKRININEPQEITYWTKALGVPKEKLIETVEKYGNSANAIKQVLGARSYV